MSRVIILKTPSPLFLRAVAVCRFLTQGPRVPRLQHLRLRTWGLIVIARAFFNKTRTGEGGSSGTEILLSAIEEQSMAEVVMAQEETRARGSSTSHGMFSRLHLTVECPTDFGQTVHVSGSSFLAGVTNPSLVSAV